MEECKLYLAATVKRSALISDQPAAGVLRDLTDVAHDGLRSCFRDGNQATSYLEPAKKLLDAQKTPADLVLDKFGDDAYAWLEAGRTPLAKIT